jgi:hypothetical protein
MKTLSDLNKSDKSPPPFGTSFPIDSTGAAHSVSIPQCIYPTPPPIRHLFEENKIHKKLLVGAERSEQRDQPSIFWSDFEKKLYKILDFEYRAAQCIFRPIFVRFNQWEQRC